MTPAAAKLGTYRMVAPPRHERGGFHDIERRLFATDGIDRVTRAAQFLGSEQPAAAIARIPLRRVRSTV